jgi:hypothetical protein
MKHQGIYLAELVTYNDELYERRTPVDGELKWFRIDDTKRISVSKEKAEKLESKYQGISTRYYSSIGMMEMAQRDFNQAVADAIESIFDGLEPKDES